MNKIIMSYGIVTLIIFGFITLCIIPNIDLKSYVYATPQESHEQHTEEEVHDHEGEEHQNTNESESSHEHEESSKSELTGEHHEIPHAHEQQVEAHGEEHAESHEGHEEEVGGLQFSAATMEEFQIQTAQAGPGTMTKHIDTPGEIVPNPDMVSHIVPRVPGVVREVKKSLGDTVQEDELLAILESRELASLKSNYLSAVERLELAQEIFEREKELWQKKISAEQEYLEAKQKLAEARINVQAAEQQLHAVGFSESYVENLTNQPDTLINRYEMRAPFSGQITEKHITLGEYVKDETSVFTIADLSKVWVHLTLYQNDLPYVQVGQNAKISFKLGNQETTGTITYISPMLDEHTRTATARVVIDNSNGQWRPGMFVNASIEIEQIPVPIYVPKTAVFTIENQPSIFVKTENGFEPSQVKIGRKNSEGFEIASGLQQGQVYVSKGGFTLKAEMDKEAFAHTGHAH